MAVPKHLEEAAKRLDAALYKIEQAREKPFSAETQREWLEGLTDYCIALAEIGEYNNESVHEKLHELAGRPGL